jgi:serine/threonine protein kinase
MAIFFKPVLRRKLLWCGWKRLANLIVPDLTNDVRATSKKMEEVDLKMQMVDMERLLVAKLQLPRLEDVTPEMVESDITLNDEDVLGIGGYGIVYRGTHHGKPVAVKAIVSGGIKGSDAFTAKMPPAVEKMMRREAMIVCSLNHPNILRIFGIVPARGWIIMELCHGGSLSEVLRDPEVSWLDALEMARIATETATGVAYLHTSGVAILHGDMKAGNVLLTKDRAVRICDFGMSEVKDRSKTMSASTYPNAAAHTVAWSAPELFNDHLKSFATDVYALGITLWEIYERRVPFVNMPVEVVSTQVLKGVRPKSMSQKTATAVREVITACWSMEPKKRPLAIEVAVKLTNMSEKLKASASEVARGRRGGAETVAQPTVKAASVVAAKKADKEAPTRHEMYLNDAFQPFDA